MIVIEDANFRMEQVSGPFFNLSFLSKINAGTEKEREEMKLVDYGLPFETCLKRIVSLEMSKEEGPFTVSEYIEKYKQIVNKMSSLVTHVEKPSRSSKKDIESEEEEENG